MKKRIGIFLCFVMLLVSTGCYDRVEPKELAVISSVMYDKKEDGTYQIFLEFVKTTVTMQGGSSGTGTNTIVISEGEAPRIAWANGAKTIEKRMYAGHAHVRLFTEGFAQNEEDMTTTLDMLLRDRLTDETPLMVVVKGEEPEKIYAADLSLSDSIGLYIHNMDYWQSGTISKGVFVTTLDFTKDFLAEGKQPVAGVIEMAESKDPSKSNLQGSSSSEGDNAKKNTKIVYEGLAAFKGMKLVGYMTGAEAQAYNFITNNIRSEYFALSARSNQTGVQVLGSACKIKTTVESGAVTLDLTLTMDLVVNMEGNSAEITRIQVQRDIEQAFDAQVQQQIKAAIQKAQTEFKSDIFGFGGYVHSQHPQDWKDLKQNWDDTFAQATVHVTVDSTITKLGETEDSVLWEEEQ